MKEIVEIFFGLAVGLPLTVIGILGLLAIIGASVISGISLMMRKETARGLIILSLVLLIALMGLDIIPAARLAGVPLLLISGMMTFSKHQSLARSASAMPLDPVIAIASLVGMVALAIPIFILMFNTAAG